MSVPHITTHVADGLARLLEQYKARPLLQGLVTALLQEGQTIEDAIQGLQAGVSLDAAQGVMLDNLGQIVGVMRNGASDATYRALLRGAIGQNNSDGSADALLRIVQAVYQTQSVFKKDPNSFGQNGASVRAAIAFGVGSPQTDASNYALVNRIITASIAAGVGLFYLSKFNAAAAFAMAGPQAWVAGFSSLADPTSGGQFANLIYSDKTV